MDSKEYQITSKEKVGIRILQTLASILRGLAIILRRLANILQALAIILQRLASILQAIVTILQRLASILQALAIILQRLASILQSLAYVFSKPIPYIDKPNGFLIFVRSHQVNFQGSNWTSVTETNSIPHRQVIQRE